MLDAFDITISSHAEELEYLREEYSFLQTHLEDFENRNRRSNLQIHKIPEAIEDLQSTGTALFQELAPFIPIERLEMVKVHRSLAPRKENGPPRDIIVKLHYFRKCNCWKQPTIRKPLNSRDILIKSIKISPNKC